MLLSLIKTFLPNLVMTIFKLMNLKGPRLILQHLYIPLYLVKFQIDISLWFYLRYPMLSLKIMIYNYQYLMVNATISLLRDMFWILSLFLTFLKLMKRMLVLGFLLFLFKAKWRVGSKPCLMQAYQISNNSSKFSSTCGCSNRTLSWL